MSEFQKSKDVDIQRPHYIFQSEEALSVTPKATPQRAARQRESRLTLVFIAAIQTVVYLAEEEGGEITNGRQMV